MRAVFTIDFREEKTMNILSILLSVLATGGVGAAILTIKQSSAIKNELKKLQSLSEEDALAQASAKAKEILLDAKKEVLEVREKAEKEAREIKREAEDVEKRALVREENLDKRAMALNGREDKIDAKERGVEQSKKDVKKLRDELAGKIEEIANLSRDEAKQLLLEEVESDISKVMARKIKDAEDLARDKADEISKRIIVDSMQKGAVDYTAETTTTTVQIPSDEMKGRIIGREGRNIRSFEKATGVDVIVDDVPGAVTVSCFDPVRREVAAIVMQRLVADGRIHPARIEDEVNKVKRDLLKEVKKTGEDLAFSAGVVGLPDEIITLLGKFKYRFSYGQNLVKHTKEMIKIGAALAAEVGADVELVKKATLLHDLGKAVTHEVEGAHHHISGQILRKYKMDEKLVNAVEAHHGDIEAKSVEAVLVYIADALSGGRPGARVENYEEYIKRIRGLEDAAMEIGKKKVKEVYAIHAGREVRVIVNPDVADDNEAKVLAHKIAKHIQDTQTYPGTVTVNVIRELRTQDVAK